jgi:hypothetical protein
VEDDINMGIRLTRSLVGYKPEEVEKIIETINREFEIAHKECNKELTNAANENQRLKEELETIKQQLGSFIVSRSKLEGILYDIYIKSIAKLFNAQKELEVMIEDKNNILLIQQNENKEIKTSINSLLNQVQMIVKD